MTQNNRVYGGIAEDVVELNVGHKWKQSCDKFRKL